MFLNRVWPQATETMENKTKHNERPESEQVANAGCHPENPMWTLLTHIISHRQRMLRLSELSVGDKGVSADHGALLSTS